MAGSCGSAGPPAPVHAHGVSPAAARRPPALPDQETRRCALPLPPACPRPSPAQFRRARVGSGRKAARCLRIHGDGRNVFDRLGFSPGMTSFPVFPGPGAGLQRAPARPGPRMAASRPSGRALPETGPGRDHLSGTMAGYSRDGTAARRSCAPGRAAFRPDEGRVIGLAGGKPPPDAAISHRAGGRMAPRHGCGGNCIRRPRIRQGWGKTLWRGGAAVLAAAQCAIWQPSPVPAGEAG